MQQSAQIKKNTEKDKLQCNPIQKGKGC